MTCTMYFNYNLTKSHLVHLSHLTCKPVTFGNWNIRKTGQTGVQWTKKTGTQMYGWVPNAKNTPTQIDGQTLICETPDRTCNNRMSSTISQMFVFLSHVFQVSARETILTWLADMLYLTDREIPHWDINQFQPIINRRWWVMMTLNHGYFIS